MQSAFIIYKLKNDIITESDKEKETKKQVPE